MGLAVLLLSSGGCGTFLNVAGLPDAGKTYPYGGVLLDGVGITCSAYALYQMGTGKLELDQMASDTSQTIGLGVLATIDLPCSIVADTLTLPWTIRYLANLKEIWQDNRKKPEEEPKKIE